MKQNIYTVTLLISILMLSGECGYEPSDYDWMVQRWKNESNEIF